VSVVIFRRVTIGVLFIAVVFGPHYWTCVASGGTSQHSDALLIYPGATQIRPSKLGGTDQLNYHVKARLPASGVIDWIEAKLWSQNWRPLYYDSLEPNNAAVASMVRGWHPFLEPSGGCVQQWMGDWQDRSGNVVRYAFRYKLPKTCAPDSDDLEVFAIYTPAALVKQGREDFKKYMHERKARYLGQTPSTK
jgi:hypothetical protein